MAETRFEIGDLIENRYCVLDVIGKGGMGTLYRVSDEAQDGDVIAFHDAGGDRSQTVDSIAPIIVGLRARHLQPVTLDQLYAGSRA